jgi:hypothetical protein
MKKKLTFTSKNKTCCRLFTFIRYVRDKLYLTLVFLQECASLWLSVEEGGKLSAIGTDRPKKREVLVKVFQQIVEPLCLAREVHHPGVSIFQFLQSL